MQKWFPGIVFLREAFVPRRAPALKGVLVPTSTGTTDHTSPSWLSDPAGIINIFEELVPKVGEKHICCLGWLLDCKSYGNPT